MAVTGAEGPLLRQRFGAVTEEARLGPLQLDTGDPKALALNARQLAQRQDLSSDQALRIAMLVRQEDSQLARSLWRRAVASDLPDDAVGAALTLGYRLGLDREVRPVLELPGIRGQTCRASADLRTMH